jgi:hypothetical protein
VTELRPLPHLFILTADPAASYGSN